MGCTSSKPQDNTEYLRQIEDLRLQLKNAQERSHEEENLLRFKIEVLVNMLTVEEQRSEIATKRLETLKWVVGTSSDLDSVRQLVHSTNESEIFGHIQPLNAELGEAIEIMRKDFVQFREDIFMALATEDGHIVSSLPKLEFMKQVYGATENVQKAELQLIAARFDDGNGAVNVPEFLDFFCTPHTLRCAKSAANAVRMSLDMLALNEQVYPNVKPDEVDDVNTRRSHFTNRLDRSAQKLLALWLFVREELLTSFSVLKESKPSSSAKKTNASDKAAPTAEVEDVVKVAIFERSLMEICGKTAFYVVRLAANSSMCETLYTKAAKTIKQKYSGKRKADDDKENRPKNQSRNERSQLDDSNDDDEDDAQDGKANSRDGTDDDASESVEVPAFPSDRLEPEDAVMLARRFELDGVVHVEGFVSFFDEAYLRTTSFATRGVPIRYDAVVTGISPFRWSTEWSDLKDTSILRQSQQRLPPPPAPQAKPRQPVPEVKAPEPPKEAVKPKEPEKPKEVPKPTPPPPVVAEPKTPPTIQVPADDKKADDKKPTAPVASTTCGCFGSKPPVEKADEKRRPNDPPTPLPRRESKPQIDDKPSAKDADDKDSSSIDDGKQPETPVREEKKVRDEPLPILKHSEEFETPPKPRAAGNRSAGFMPDRDGLGHEDDQRRARLNADLGGVPTPIGTTAAAPAAGSRRRLRRHEDRDFAHEKSGNPLEGDSDEDIDGGAVRFNAPRSRAGR